MTLHGSPSFPPHPLRALGGHALEMALNQALALDPETRDGVQALEGRGVQVHLRGPELAFAIRVADGKLKVGPAGDTPGALRMSATPGGLLAMALHADENGPAPGKLEIAGDAELARRLQTLARGYAPDVEAVFARVFGEVAGVPLARAFAAALAHARDSASHFVEDGADWVREEARLGVAPGEMDEFLDGVDRLRERCERIEARIQRLATRSRTHT